MARKFDNRTFNVAVVGFSGTEKEKGVEGIGKSCFCNRFMRPLADDYKVDHISVLSQSDFGGRVVNNDHFLYWGETMKTSDEGTDINFHVIEQTEFIDDTSFQPFKCGKTEPYYKRCAQTKLQSAEKLMYICKNQLGLEHDFEQKLLPDGKTSVDGFLCLFDVSIVHQRPFERQLEYTSIVLQNLVKTKKPVVFVTTKNDKACDTFVRDAEKLVSKQRGNIPIVECSAHCNINVELAFLTLAHLIDRTKGRPKIVPYVEAAKSRKEIMDVALEAYKHLVRSQVMDHRALWTPILRQLQHHPDYGHFVELSGTEKAKQIFMQHIRNLRKEFIDRRQELYLEKLKDILNVILPDLITIADRSWPATLRWIQRQDFFDQYFVTIPEGRSWWEPEFIEGAEERIPYDLLDRNEAAENCFLNHVNALRAEHKRSELRKQFKQLLQDNHNVAAGKSLSEVAIFFLGRECFSILSEEDKQAVYEQHQLELRDRAKHEFQELLFEHADFFANLSPRREITPEDFKEINEKLQNELRYKALNRLEEDRKVILLNHLGFLQCPSKDRCHFREQCMEVLIENILSTKAHRPQSWNCESEFQLDAEDHRLNLVILGNEGLSDQLAKEIRLQCVEDEYTLGGQTHSLDYRPIDGDVNLPQYSLRTQDFTPHGCFCVFNSSVSLEYLRESLENTLLSDSDPEDRSPFQGLPVVVVLAHNPALTDKGLELLREEGQSLADRLQCPFIDIPSSMMVNPSRKFHEDQIGLAMHDLIRSIRHRTSLLSPYDIEESIEPDIRILMTFMCGDTFNIELPLAPLLNHQCCYVTSEKYPTITLETYLDDSKRKVEVTLVSYHGASLVKDELYHGYILVYSTKRKASLATLSAFSMTIPQVPTKILAVTESGGANAFFSNEFTQNLLTEGNAIADRMQASFMTTSANFQQQTASYTPFFKEAWDRKIDTESAFQFSGDEDSTPIMESIPMCTMEKIPLDLSRRPPAVLPKPPKRFDSFGVHNKSSTSNSQSTEDSEPVYDQLHMHHQCHSDSEPDRTSSASPPICDTSPYNTVTDDVYSEIAPRDTDQLIKPSHVKTRRSMYAGFYDDPVYDSTTPLLSQMENPSYDAAGRKSPPPTLPKPKPPTAPKPKPLDQHKFADVRHVLQRNMTQTNNRSFPLVKAPLATPEPIEIGDYAQVKDALSPAENDYALVHDALPAGKLHRIRSTFRKAKSDAQGTLEAATDSDSEFSSLERENRRQGDIYARVNRRPTPHKKKHKPRHSDSSLPPPLPPYTDDRHQLLYQDQLEKVRSNSPSEGSEGTGDEQNNTRKQKKRRSIRSKKKKHTESDSVLVISPPWSDSDLGMTPGGRICMEDDGAYEPVTPRDLDGSGRYEDGDDIDAGYWKRKLRLKSEKDPDKQRRKEEKKAKEDEKRKMKEEEKKLKEQQKLQRKMKKKDSRAGSGPPQITLEDMVQSEEKLVPFFVEKCVGFIEEEGLTVEGIYRVPGNKAHVDLLLERFKEDPMVDIRSLDIPVNAVATALKGFFSELPEPLVPNHFYDELIETANIRDRSSRLHMLHSVLRKLPQVNFEVLKYLMTHIHKVTKHSDENSMDSKNLGICWWPTILRPDFTSFETMTLASKLLEDIMVNIIEQFEYFFYDENEV